MLSAPSIFGPHQPAAPGCLPGAAPWAAPSAARGAACDMRDALARLDDMAEENAALREELGRCYRHLGAVFQITDKIAPLRGPQDIEQAVLRCYADLLGAEHLLIVDDRPLRAVAAAGAHNAAAAQVPDLAELRDAIAEARRQPRSLRATLPADADPCAGWSVLIAGFRNTRSESAALVALRAAGAPPFEIGDELVCETVLAYGGHILQNALMARRVQQSAFETVCALANAVEARDPYTRGHCERVGWLARRTGQALRLPADELHVLEWSGILHDVGKIGVPEAVLNKPDRLSPSEFAEIRRHPCLGHEVLRPISMLEPVLPGVLHHHENYDGTGYPDRLAGEAIPLIARILRVVDTFDALTSNRAYRGGQTAEAALATIERGAGREFDPQVARCFVRMARNWIATGDAEFRQRFGAVAPPPAASETHPASTAAAGAASDAARLAAALES